MVMETTSIQFIWKNSPYWMFLLTQEPELPSGFQKSGKNLLVEGSLSPYLLSANQLESQCFFSNLSSTLHSALLRVVFFSYNGHPWVNQIIMPCTPPFTIAGSMISVLPCLHPETVLYKREKHALIWQICNFGFRILICQPWFSHPAMPLHP